MSRAEKATKYQEAPVEEQALSALSSISDFLQVTKQLNLTYTTELSQTLDALYRGEQPEVAGINEVSEHFNRLSRAEVSLLMAALPTLTLRDSELHQEAKKADKKYHRKFNSISKLETKIESQQTKEENFAKKQLLQGTPVKEIKIIFQTKGWSWNSTKARLFEAYDVTTIKQLVAELKNPVVTVPPTTETPAAVETVSARAKVLEKVEPHLRPVIEELLNMFAGYIEYTTHNQLYSKADQIIRSCNNILGKHALAVDPLPGHARLDKIKPVLVKVANLTEYNHLDLIKFAAANDFTPSPTMVKGTEEREAVVLPEDTEPAEETEHKPAYVL